MAIDEQLSGDTPGITEGTLREIREAYRNGDLAALGRFAVRYRDVRPDPAVSSGLLQETMAMARAKNDRYIENRVLNDQEFEQRKTVLSSHVRSLHVTVTARCNQRCVYCFQAHFTKREKLSDQACEGIMEVMPYLQRTTWQGGEAFLHPRFKEMIEESVKNPYLEQTLITNGLFLNVPWLDLFARAKTFNLVVPVQTLRKEVYDGMCKGGKFDLLHRNIGLVNEYQKKFPNKFFLSLNMIMMKRNYTEIENVVQYAVEKGFSNIIITPLYANGTEFYEGEYLSPENPEVREYFAKVMPRVEEVLRRNRINISNRFITLASPPDAGQRPEARQEPEPQPRPPLGSDRMLCLAPWQQLYLESNGEVRCHCYCPFRVGDLNANSLREIWNGEQIVRIRESLLDNRYDLCNPACTQGILSSENLKLE